MGHGRFSALLREGEPRRSACSYGDSIDPLINTKGFQVFDEIGEFGGAYALMQQKIQFDEFLIAEQIIELLFTGLHTGKPSVSFVASGQL